MNYAEWIREQHRNGVKVEAIAEAVLDGPIACISDDELLASLLARVSELLAVPLVDIRIVGSARLGFSLRDGSAFDPAYSDLDIAVVSMDLYLRCAASSTDPLGVVRFPERDLPASDRVLESPRIS